PAVSIPFLPSDTNFSKKLFMKNSFVLIRLMTIVLFTSLIFFGCKKENSQSSRLSPQQEEEVARVSVESETETQLAFNDVFDNVMGANNQVGVAGTGVFGKVASGSYLSV